MKKTNFTIHSLARVAATCCLSLLLTVLSFTATAQAPVCIGKVNVSMPIDTCYRELGPADFVPVGSLAGADHVVFSYPFGTNTNFTPLLPGYAGIDRSHIGYTFIYRVYYLDGNSCWGYITVEDKAGPDLSCFNRRASCALLEDLTTGLGLVKDNCSGLTPPVLQRVTYNIWGDGCTDPRGIGQVYREIRGYDVWGNSSLCLDTITIIRNSLSDVRCPTLLSMACTYNCGGTTIIWDRNANKATEFKAAAGTVQVLYPTPTNLVLIKKAACGLFTAIDTVVPVILDSIFLAANGTLLNPPIVKGTDFYKSSAGICKLVVGYTDEVYELCPNAGSSFKIRRQWRITNWCTGRDTLCIQYIKVEDKLPPVYDSGRKDIYANASAHDCYADITLRYLEYDDCNSFKEYYTIEVVNPLDGKIKILAGELKEGVRVRLPSHPYQDCYTVNIRITDACLNTANDNYRICVRDITPPTPVCDEYTVTTVDPATCWARVYAEDLDNGSRDNCCNVLHFAVATMAADSTARALWVNYWNSNCKADYWNNKERWDKYLESYINTFVYKDYIDLTECGDHRVILRVYEACGVPRYDPHVFPCSEHDWFTYNTFKLARIWHNYQFFGKGTKSCTALIAPVCNPRNWSPSGYTWDYSGRYIGSTISTPGYRLDNDDCTFVTVLPSADVSNGQAPGNRCSARLYNDCMVNVHVDDKTPPVCEGIRDLYYYCDGVFDVQTDGFPDYASEYANLYCYLPQPPFANYTCGPPYKNIEYTSENEINEYAGTDSADYTDPTRRYYGYYGCAEGVSGHPIDEHNPQISSCPINTRSGGEGPVVYSNGWAPIYCHSWLTLDKYDHAGKLTTPKFWTPKMISYGKKGTVKAGTENGQFSIWDNCILGTPTTQDASYIDQCGNGWLSRTWTVGDKCETGKITCTQKIYTKHRSDFEVMFPVDVVAVCGSDDNLSPDVTGRPMVWDDDCELVGVNYSDVRYDIIGDACYKIVRTWTLIDWCKYDPNAHHRFPEVIYDDRTVASADRYCVFTKLKDDGDGYMTYTQIIKIKDTVPPVIACRSDTLCITTGYNGFGDTTQPLCSVPGYSQVFVATDNCTPASSIQFRYIIKNAGGVSRPSGPKVTGFTAINGDLTPGLNTLTVIASDKCGQEDTTTCTIFVKDCKKPTPYCYDGIATVVMPSSGTVTVWASDLNAGSYDNCTPKAKLFYTFDAAGTQQSKDFKCADAKPGQATMYVWDGGAPGKGNFDFCTVSLSIQSNDPACQPAAGAAGAIAGKIATESTEPVENVILDAKASTFKTDSKGTYAFTGLTTKQDYTITPKRDDDPTNGVSTIDLVLIQKHILGVQPLNSAYKVIAADVDRSNDVSAVDLVELRKLILTVYDKLPNNTSWRFVPKAYNFSNTTNPWGFPEKIDITGLTKDELNRDFVGVKIGDVNGTVVPHSLLGAEAREAGTSLKFRTSDRQLKAGEEAIVEFTAENFNNIEGYQFSLAVKGLELKAVNSGVLKVSEGNFGMTKLGEGYVTTSWNDSKGITATGSEVLFSIKVKATKALTLSEALVINSKYTRAEAYNSGSNLGVVLEVGTKSVSGYALHQNTPNPFKATTVISYNLAKSDKVTLKITDVTGKVVRVYTESGVKGYNQLTVNRTDVSGAGVLYYTIETKDYSATKKMILVD